MATGSQAIGDAREPVASSGDELALPTSLRPVRDALEEYG